MIRAIRFNPVLRLLDRKIQTPSSHLQIAVRLCHTNNQHTAITHKLTSLLQLATFINFVIFGFATSISQCPYCSKKGRGPLISVPFEVVMLIVEFLCIATAVELWYAAPCLANGSTKYLSCRLYDQGRNIRRHLRDCWMLAAPDSSPCRNSR
jgi:hypothetical protein